MGGVDSPDLWLAAAGLAWLTEGLRLVLAVACVLLCGWVLARVLAPGLSVGLQRLGWALGAGLAVLMVGGLVLHGLGGLTSAGWWAALCVPGLLAGGWAWRRRPGGPAAEGSAHAGLLPPQALGAALRTAVASSGLRPLDLGAGLLALGLLAGALAVARAGAAEAARKPYTEFWAVPAAAASQVLVGVRNREGQAMAYRVEVSTRARVITQWDVAALPAGAVDEHALAWAPGAGGREAPADLQITLYRAGESTPYRHVSVSR